MTNLNIREIQSKEYSVLEKFLYNAIYVPFGEELPARKVIFEPEIYIYVENFGRRDDCGVVAEQDGELLIGVWRTTAFRER